MLLDELHLLFPNLGVEGSPFTDIWHGSSLLCFIHRWNEADNPRGLFTLVLPPPDSTDATLVCVRNIKYNDNKIHFSLPGFFFPFPLTLLKPSVQKSIKAITLPFAASWTCTFGEGGKKQEHGYNPRYGNMACCVCHMARAWTQFSNSIVGLKGYPHILFTACYSFLCVLSMFEVIYIQIMVLSY